MSLHGDLLAQARHLLRKEPRRPKQASLRRAISTAYYALFHLLVHESSRRLISGDAQASLRALTARAYDHGTMRQASRAFASGGLPPALQRIFPEAAPPEIRKIAGAFVDLQDARHSADYDITLKLTRQDADTALIPSHREANASMDRLGVATILPLHKVKACPISRSQVEDQGCRAAAGYRLLDLATQRVFSRNEGKKTKRKSITLM